MERKASLLHIMDPQEVQRLINEGSDVNVEDESGYSALHGACFCGKNKVVELLIDNGAHVDVKDIDGVTPLMCAAGNGHAETVRTLITKGASVTAVNFYGGTAYTRACSGGYQNVITVLAEEMFNRLLLAPVEEYRCYDTKSCSLTKLKFPRRNESPLWIVIKDGRPDFNRIYASVEEDRESSCFITTSFNGSRFRTQVTDDTVVEEEMK